MNNKVAALAAFSGPGDERFAQAVQMVLATTGRLVVMGMGKVAMGRKLPPWRSTGTPGFVQLCRAGRSGRWSPGAPMVLAISNSGSGGSTAILPVLKPGRPLIALTGGLRSTPAQHADLVLDCSVEREACPLNLALHRQHHRATGHGDALARGPTDMGLPPEDFPAAPPVARWKLLTRHARRRDAQRRRSGCP